MSREVWLRGTAVLLLLAAVLLLTLIGAGAFDPQPLGDVRWQQSLTKQTIPAQTRQIFWLERPLPAAPYSIRLTAAHAAGESDSLYGLALGSDTDYLTVAISPLGYVTIWREGPSSVSRIPSAVFRQPIIGDGVQNTEYGLPITDYLPLQPWPHVRPGAATNEIWVDGKDGRFTVRVNREWVWTGEVGSVDGAVGVMGESFGRVSVVDFQTMTLYAERP